MEIGFSALGVLWNLLFGAWNFSEQFPKRCRNTVWNVGVSWGRLRGLRDFLTKFGREQRRRVLSNTGLP